MAKLRLVSEHAHISYKPLWSTTFVFFLLALLVRVFGPIFLPHGLTHLVSWILVILAGCFALAYLAARLLLWGSPKLLRWQWRKPRDW